ncbi:class I SAM-dependent methyltransferase [Shewanella submarina]|uniref:Class I SAM-dependent methyltransferase n=1 Tax=Shewanella submarina TaxID=2016376 RepID=A0ABV7GAI4_9GAMM|nr:class I SAM-dependent methyltransferase [Shewanella submarina]MCL1037340.1 class I SAM-dependent methyltransferase [Shewanella submarina]
MASAEIQQYLDATENRPVREELRLAVSLVEGEKIAIDCGCGAGSDIDFLRSQGFQVYAFDIEREAIARCNARFSGDTRVSVSVAGFQDFVYPSASLVVADASLFFCPPKHFAQVWEKICQCLPPGGVFAGSFLGAEDTMTGTDFDRQAYWPDILVTDETEIRQWFEQFDIVSFKENRASGEAPDGKPHQWHIYSVVAKKLP